MDITQEALCLQELDTSTEEMNECWNDGAKKC